MCDSACRTEAHNRGAQAIEVLKTEVHKLHNRRAYACSVSGGEQKGGEQKGLSPASASCVGPRAVLCVCGGVGAHTADIGRGRALPTLSSPG
jgi:hypothetical protein